jgi:hypothetical protein
LERSIVGLIAKPIVGWSTADLGLTIPPAFDYIVKLGSNQPTRWMAGFAPALLIENRGRDV